MERHRQLIDAGRVSCPMRGAEDVDIERCYLCPWFEGLSSLGPAEAVVCRAPAQAFLELLDGQAHMGRR
jgi:hypothetical protein